VIFMGQTPQRGKKVWGNCHKNRHDEDAVIFRQEWGCIRIYFNFHKAYTRYEIKKENTMYTILVLFAVRVVLPVGALLLIGGWLRRKQEEHVVE
jgi:hypothetical protein